MQRARLACVSLYSDSLSRQSPAHIARTHARPARHGASADVKKINFRRAEPGRKLPGASNTATTAPPWNNTRTHSAALSLEHTNTHTLRYTQINTHTNKTHALATEQTFVALLRLHPASGDVNYSLLRWRLRECVRASRIRGQFCGRERERTIACELGRRWTPFVVA